MADVSSFSKTFTSIASATYADSSSPLTTNGTSINLHTQQLPVQGGALGLTNGVTAVCTVGSIGANGSVVFTIQGSQNNSDWFDLAAASAVTANGIKAVNFAGPAPQYVRVKAVNTDSDGNPTAVLSAVVIAGGR